MKIFLVNLYEVLYLYIFIKANYKNGSENRKNIEFLAKIDYTNEYEKYTCKLIAFL